jgi:hypothetical protein
LATLGEILQHRQGVAEAAASLRFYNDTVACLNKVAEDKEAAGFGSAALEGLGRIRRNVLHSIRHMGHATEVANQLELSQMAIGNALKSHFHNTFPAPAAGASRDELASYAKRVSEYVAMPTTIETVEKAWNPGSKEFEIKGKRTVPAASMGSATLKSMGEVQKTLEPKRTGMNTVLGIVAGGGFAGGLVKEKFFHGHKKNLDTILADPQIPKSHHGRAKAVFEMVAKYAPSIASDPTVSKDVTKNLIRYDTIDHKTVKDLMDAERIFTEVHGRKAQFDSVINHMSGGSPRGRR